MSIKKVSWFLSLDTDTLCNHSLSQPRPVSTDMSFIAQRTAGVTAAGKHCTVAWTPPSESAVTLCPSTAQRRGHLTSLCLSGDPVAPMPYRLSSIAKTCENLHGDLLYETQTFI